MKALLLASLLLPAVSFAEDVTCTISSGGDSQSATFDLKKDKDFINGAYVNDLGFDLEVEKEAKTATANLIIYSSILEDEAGSFSFTFDLGGKTSREVAREPLTDTPDGQPYEIVCVYTP